MLERSATGVLELRARPQVDDRADAELGRVVRRRPARGGGARRCGTARRCGWSRRRAWASRPDRGSCARPRARRTARRGYPSRVLLHTGSIPLRRPVLRTRLHYISFTPGRFRCAVPSSGHGSTTSPSHRVDSVAPSRPPDTAPLHLLHTGSIPLRRPVLRTRLHYISSFGTFQGDDSTRYPGAVAARIDAARASMVSVDFSPGR